MTIITRALETLFELLPGQVRIADAGGRILRSNGGAIADDESPTTLRSLWERERPTKTGATECIPFVETPAMRALAGMPVTEERLRVRRNAREVDIEASAVPIRDDEGLVIGALLVDQDVAPGSAPAEKESGRAKETGRGDEDRHMSMAAKLAAGIMHDVNNVLSPIMGAAFLLQRNADSPAKVREYAERIRMAAESGAEMTARVARFVRQEPLHAGGGGRVDLSALTSETLDEFDEPNAAPVAQRPTSTRA